MKRARAPFGWKIDNDGWFYRGTRSSDAAKIAAFETPHHMFVGDDAEAGRTYCCEPDEATYLDGEKP
jgi:hypothetical protein